MFIFIHRNCSRFFFDFSKIVIFSGILFGIANIFLGDFHKRNGFKAPIAFVISSWVILIFTGIYLVSIWGPGLNSSHFRLGSSKNTIYGVLVLRETSNTGFYRKYLAEVKSVNRMKSSGFLWLRVNKTKDSVSLKPGELILTNLKIREIENKRNPGGFDYKEYSRRKGVEGELILAKREFLRTRSNQNTFQAKALNYREHLSFVLNQQGFGQMEKSLLDALLLGKKTQMNKELSTGYRKAGAMHLLAISGLHVGILLFFIRSLLMPFRRWKFGKILIITVPFLGLWLFAFLTGLSPSVSRAVIMFSLISIALNLKRSNHLNHILFTAFFISLIWKPLYLFDPGFQLSYLAVFSIVNLRPGMTILWTPKNKIKLYLWNLSTVSIAAQIGVLPLILFYFHEFSGLFLASSLLLIPLLGVILGFGYLLLFMLQFDMAPEWYIQIYSLMIRLMNKTVLFLGQFDALIVNKVFFSKTLLTLSLLFLCALFFYKTKEISKAIIALMLFLTLFTTSVLNELAITNRGSSFIVFHNFNKSLIIKKKERSVTVLRKTDMEPGLDLLLENYQIELCGLRINKEACIQNVYEMNGKRIMIIDSEGIVTDFDLDPDIILLLNSPKINLERFLKKVQPELIIADGSNYNFLKQRWLKTSFREGVTFYDTAISGAFELNSET